MKNVRPKVLAVDDDPDLLMLLRSTLQLEGYSSDEVGDGKAAIEKLAGGGFDAVLLDLMMPRVDGWAVLRHASRKTGGPRFVVVSAKSGDDDRSKAYRLGAVAYLTKPFDPAALMATLRAVLDRTPEETEHHRQEMLTELRRAAEGDTGRAATG